MKILDIRNTQSGWVADVLLSPLYILPVSIPVSQCNPFDMIDYANTDKQHINIVINWNNRVMFDIGAIAENIRSYSNTLKERIDNRMKRVISMRER